MRIIITGGSGLIGRALTSALAEKRYEVVILSRSPEKVKNLPTNARAVAWDSETAEGWGHLADGAKAIVNLAGANIGGGRWTDERKQLILNSRLNAGKAVVEAVQAANQKPEVVVQSSAVGYYGNRGDEPLTEASAPQPGYFMSDVCVAWEASVEPIKDEVRLVIIRTGVVISDDNEAFEKLALPFKLFVGGPLGSGEQWFSWIHLQDEVNAIIALIENEEASGVYNLTAPEPVKNKEFAKVMGEVMHRPAFMPAPAFAIKLALGEMSAVALDGQRVYPQHLEKLGYNFAFPSIKPAVEEAVE